MSPSMPKFSILSSISDEILPWLCSDDPIQTLLKMAWFLTLRTKPFLEGFVWSHWSITVVITRLQFVLHTRVCFYFYRVVKCDVTKIKIFEPMGFVEIIWEIKGKNVSLPRISMWIQIVLSVSLNPKKPKRQ